MARHTASEASGLPAVMSGLHFSSAYIKRFVVDEAHVMLAPDAEKVVLCSLMASCVLGAYPQTFSRKQWIEQVSHHPRTFEPLKPDQADLVLAIGVSSGVLDEVAPGQTYAVPNEHVRQDMESLLVLAYSFETQLFS